MGKLIYEMPINIHKQSTRIQVSAYRNGTWLEDGGVIIWKGQNISGLYTLYPNPSHGQVTIGSDKPESPFHYQIFNVLGKLVSQGFGQVGIPLNLGLPAGQYWMRADTENGIYQSPMMILE